MDIQTLTFGVEIECTIPYAAFMAAGWSVGSYHRGLPIPGFEANGWNLQSDSSVHTRGNNIAVEVVSGILRGTEGLNAVKAMVAKLSSMGAKVNASCGFHVHVGFNGDAAALARLVHLTAHVEPALRAASGSVNRESGGYCRSIKSSFAVIKGQTPASLDEIRRHYEISNHRSRYHVLNLTNLLGGTRPAVEFRAFSGTMNFAKMAGYIQLCLGLVQKAIEVRKQVEWDAPALTDKSAVKRGGVYQTELLRLFAILGWTKAFNCTPRGILSADSIGPAMDVMKKMAVKYDTAKGTLYQRPAAQPTINTEAAL